MGDIKELPEKDYEETLDELNKKYNNINCQLKDIEDIANKMIASLPKLNRTALREEMGQMHVDILLEPTTASINEGLAKAQAYRERLSGILVLADREYNVREKALEMVTMANSVFSKASSADKRKGEALMKYSMQFIHLEAAETFKDEVQTILNNMKSTSETVSRQASVLQAQIELGEVRKKNNDAWIENFDVKRCAEEMSKKDF